MTTTSVCQTTPVRNQPWIAALIGNSAATKYLVICEQKEIAIVSLLESALYMTFSLYYCFNLYPEKAKWMYFFCKTTF